MPCYHHISIARLERIIKLRWLIFSTFPRVFVSAPRYHKLLNHNFPIFERFRRLEPASTTISSNLGHLALYLVFVSSTLPLRPTLHSVDLNTRPRGLLYH